MRRSVKTALVAVTLGAIVTAPLSSAIAGGQSAASTDSRGGDSDGNDRERLDIVGLVDGIKLVSFRSDDTRLRSSTTVRGLTGDRWLVGIDYRVQDNTLYGVGNAGGVYSIERGRATKVKQLTVALSGTHFGVDFNPAANALRIISDTGQNLRQSFADRTLPTAVDGTLAYPPVAPATTPTTATGVTGAAYTNNDLDPDTATTLYDLDTTLDQIVIQSPANAGLLAATGKLRADAGPNAGFDIYSTVRDGSTVDLMAFAVLQVGGTYGLYEITLFNGRAELVDTFARDVTDLAIPLNQL